MPDVQADIVFTTIAITDHEMQILVGLLHHRIHEVPDGPYRQEMKAMYAHLFPDTESPPSDDVLP